MNILFKGNKNFFRQTNFKYIKYFNSLSISYKKSYKFSFVDIMFLEIESTLKLIVEVHINSFFSNQTQSFHKSRFISNHDSVLA